MGGYISLITTDHTIKCLLNIVVTLIVMGLLTWGARRIDWARQIYLKTNLKADWMVCFFVLPVNYLLKIRLF